MTNSGNKPCSTTSNYHKYNTRNRKPHRYNTRNNGMSCSVFLHTVNRADATTSSRSNCDKRKGDNHRMDSIPSTPSASSSIALVPKQNVQPTPSPENASSCCTPKQSNCAKHNSPNLQEIKNPYRQPPKLVTAHKPTVSKVIENPYNTVKSGVSNRVSTLQEVRIAGWRHCGDVSLISPLATPPKRRELSNAEKARIASNRAKALVLRAKAGSSKNRMVDSQPQRDNAKDGCIIRIGDLYCAICHSIMNPYAGGRLKKEGQGASMCDACVSNIQFTQDSSTSEDL